MVRRSPDPAAALEVRLGYRFTERAHLQRALTHVSVAPGEPARNNQRMEFLGDRVLGLAVADLLYGIFPDATEGELSHRLADLVRRETCALMAAAWELGGALQLAAGENRSGLRRNPTVLADAAEAVLAAVFLDGGFAAARDLVQRTLGPRVSQDRKPALDAKPALQEWALARGWATPAYVILDRSGPDHRPLFRIAARVHELPEGVGEGGSRRAAEQAAAAAVLVREGIWRGPSRAEADDVGA